MSNPRRDRHLAAREGAVNPMRRQERSAVFVEDFAEGCGPLLVQGCGGSLQEAGDQQGQQPILRHRRRQPVHMLAQQRVDHRRVQRPGHFHIRSGRSACRKPGMLPQFRGDHRQQRPEIAGDVAAGQVPPIEAGAQHDADPARIVHHIEIGAVEARQARGEGCARSRRIFSHSGSSGQGRRGGTPPRRGRISSGSSGR